MTHGANVSFTNRPVPSVMPIDPVGLNKLTKESSAKKSDKSWLSVIASCMDVMAGAGAFYVDPSSALVGAAIGAVYVAGKSRKWMHLGNLCNRAQSVDASLRQGVITLVTSGFLARCYYSLQKRLEQYNAMPVLDRPAEAPALNPISQFAAGILGFRAVNALHDLGCRALLNRDELKCLAR